MRLLATYGIILISGFVLGCKSSASQTNSLVTRIEFNSSARTFQNKIILTKDSVYSKEENFRAGNTPLVKFAAMTNENWSSLLESINNISLSQISDLKSPTDKRTYDAAAHGLVVLTTNNGASYTHGFDDEHPNELLMPLMKRIRRIRDELKTDH